MLRDRAQKREIFEYARQLHKLPMEERLEAAQHIARLLGLEDPAIENSRMHFLPFVRRMWPDFIHGRHHDIMADAFERIESGEIKRLIINMPPRSTKSRLTSVYFPAWYLGKYPGEKIMLASNAASLSMDFGRDLRNAINSPEYQAVFPGVGLAQDARAAYRWNTSQGGQFFAVGKTGAAAGRGVNPLDAADLGIDHTDTVIALALSLPNTSDSGTSWVVNRMLSNG